MSTFLLGCTSQNKPIVQRLKEVPCNAHVSHDLARTHSYFTRTYSYTHGVFGHPVAASVSKYANVR